MRKQPKSAAFCRRPYLTVGCGIVYLLAFQFVSMGEGHNGSVAWIAPIEGITVDGDLQDWPQGVETHAITHFGYGDAPSGKQDLSAHFRMGYHVDTNGLFVAVEVKDDSTVLDPHAGSAWDTQEGCSIYLDEAHENQRPAAQQYFLCGRQLQLRGYLPDASKVEVEVGGYDGRRVYEWRIQLSPQLRERQSFGFDLDVTDKDDDGSFTWAAWGAGTQKTVAHGRTGDVVLLPSDALLGRLCGRVQWQSDSGSWPFPSLGIASLTKPGFSIRIKTDKAGKFCTRLPAGSYDVNPIGSHRRRVVESKQPHRHVAPGRETDAGILRITKGPNFGMRQLIDEFVLQERVTGLAVAITRDGKIVFSEGFGVCSLETQQPVTPDSLFHTASLSKPFVATAIMQLVEADKLALDDKVCTHLPYFRLDDPRYSEITIRQMLQHTSGMPDVKDYEWETPQLDAGAPERYVRSLSESQLISAPGEKWRYSNMAFDVLGDLIAKVSSEPFDDYVKDHILIPLGMQESTFRYPDTNKLRRTSPHERNNGVATVSDVYPYNRRHAPSSTLNSNVIEMARWSIANLNRGELDGTRILQANSYDDLWDASVQIDDEEQGGLSWFMYRHRDEPVVGHSGSDLGFVSQLALLPKRNVGLVLLSNDSGTPISKLRNRLLNAVLAEE